MRNWDKHLPRRKQDPKKMPVGIMVRPDAETIKWVVDKSLQHKCTYNKFVLAVLRGAMDEDKELTKKSNEIIRSKVGPSVAEQLESLK